MPLAFAVVLAVACNGRAIVATDQAPSAPSGGPLPPDIVSPDANGPAYPGTGFRVHEWGTNTVVVGTDGVMLRGLHHEEEDLPSFVYDRTRAEVAQDPTTVKMETPVTYFHSDHPLVADVRVTFPKGIFTQWYPRVEEYAPPVYAGMGDPVLDRNYPFSSPECREHMSRAENGVLGWRRVSVLARDASPNLPPASLERYTWSHARAVSVNPLRLTDASGASEEERFLFYRGLGNFPLDVKVTATSPDGGVALANADPKNATGAVFVLRVEKDSAGFLVRPNGIAAGATLEATAPAATQPIDAYVQDLARVMITALDAAGLYHDEATAMVKTWARQWFRTPGVRVLYLAPRAWTDAQIPLAITPAPDETVRVMMIRVEALTHVEEQADVAAARLFAADPAQAKAYFDALGRFAEPRLRRAIALDPPSDATLAYLDGISGAAVAARISE